MNIFTISTAELMAVNAIAVQYFRRTDLSSLISCTSDHRTAFVVLSTPFIELTVVNLVINLSVHRTDSSTELLINYLITAC